MIRKVDACYPDWIIKPMSVKGFVRYVTDNQWNWIINKIWGKSRNVGERFSVYIWKEQRVQQEYPARKDSRAADPPRKLKRRKRFRVYPPCYTVANFLGVYTRWYTLACFFQRVVQRVRFRRVTEGGSSDRTRSGNAFHNRDPLYANIRFPYWLLKLGVSSRRKSSGLPLKVLYGSLRLLEHCPLIILFTKSRILNTTQDSTFNQWRLRNAIVIVTFSSSYHKSSFRILYFLQFIHITLTDIHVKAVAVVQSTWYYCMDQPLNMTLL